MSELDKDDIETLDEIRDFYDSTYYQDNRPKPPRRHDFALLKKIDVNMGNRVLDVACGTGEWLQACWSKGATPCGIDLSERAIATCKQVMPEGEFYVQAAEKLPFPDNSFDVVTCLGSIEHFVQPEQALAEMMRVAKEDACFVLLVPNSDFLTRKLGLFAGTYQVDAREVVRPLDEWRSMFEGAGLEITSMWKDLHVVSWDWIKKGKWYQIPLRFLQAIVLPLWPIKWQYQVFHLCRKRSA